MLQCPFDTHWLPRHILTNCQNWEQKYTDKDTDTNTQSRIMEEDERSNVICGGPTHIFHADTDTEDTYQYWYRDTIDWFMIDTNT